MAALRFPLRAILSRAAPPSARLLPPLHAHLVVSGRLAASPAVLTSLVSLYARYPAALHPAIPLLLAPSAPLPCFNAALSLPHALALPLFRRLRLAHSPDAFSFPPLLSSAPSPPHLLALHALALRCGLARDLFCASAMLRACLKFGLADHAHSLFDELTDLDVVVWNAMVNGFAKLGCFDRALECFRKMREEGAVEISSFTVTGILSVCTATADLGRGSAVHGLLVKSGFDKEASVCNALIDLYGKCHHVDDATRVFEGMAETDKDLFSWNSMLSALQYSADHVGTMRLFARMRCSAVWPDALTVAAVLPACAQTASLQVGRQVHGYIVTSGLARDGALDVFACNALADMYAKSGGLDESRRVFDWTHQRDVASWNIMIDGYASHGHGQEALELFQQMTEVEEGLVPDEVTLLGALSACSHSGLVEEGKGLLRRMKEEFGLEPQLEHYACVTDILGRAGRLDEARQVVEEAGDVGAGAWRTYLAACRMHGDKERAQETARMLMVAEESGSGGWVLLANTYGWDGNFEELEEVRGEMRRRGVQKAAPGCSWVEVGGENGGSGTVMHAFVSGDRGHPEADMIYEMLHALIGWMKDCSHLSNIIPLYPIECP
ncbi:pentatricopeptide repeat-containing protein At3g14730-like [Phragmites australis]|uniref:pentatricopeptide repeat-containing protein At3g14730-like n=1 Tax=Phragmites australis TaxID=29695 RepID=UPI002D76FFEC|nr:pentatricopeptide repeat-containing protein At3g14730-like [Phragmites australis]